MMGNPKNTKAINMFLDKEVQIFPGDTYKKRGIVKAIDDAGVTILITYYNGSDNRFEVGKLQYYSHADVLTLKEF
jgi:hypothetical protein